MDDLSPAAKRFLNAHRADGTPSSAQRARGRAAVAAFAASSTAAAATGLGLGAKVLIAALASGVVAGALVVPRLLARAEVALPPPPPVVVLTPPAVVEAPAPAVVEPPPPPTPPKRVVRAPAPPAPSVEAPAAEDPPPPAPTPDELLREEVRLLKVASGALKSGDPAAALAALDEHRQRFGEQGRLTEEALAARVRALCAKGSASEAREAFEALKRFAPTSAQLELLRAACW